MRNVPNKLCANHQLHLMGDVAGKKCHLTQLVPSMRDCLRNAGDSAAKEIRNYWENILNGLEETFENEIDRKRNAPIASI